MEASPDEADNTELFIGGKQVVKYCPKLWFIEQPGKFADGAGHFGGPGTVSGGGIL